MKFSRRDFIKACAVSTALVSAGCSSGRQPVQSKPIDPTKTEADKWVKSVCRYCGTGCGVMIGVKNGKVVAVKGDPENPVNKGLLCAKGYYLPQIMTAKDRITKPLIKKDGKFVEASWDEAMKLITQRFKESLDQYGPTSVGFYGSGQTSVDETYVANKLWKGCFGSNNVEGNPRLCMASAVAGYMTTFGADEPMGTYDDFEHCDVFFIIGSNTAEAHPVLFSRIVDHKRKNPGTKIIIADPRRHRSHEIADSAIPFIAGTDLAILGAMAYVIIEEGFTDEEFIKNHVCFSDGANPITWEDYKQHIKESYTPEFASAKSSIPVQEIRKLARDFAEPGKNTMTLWCMGINQRVAGVFANNMIHNLHLITGKICKPGSTTFSLTGQPSACGSVREVGGLSHLLPGHRLVANAAHREQIAKIWGTDPAKMAPAPGWHTMELFRRTVTGDLKCLWVMCTNPAHSLPNATFYHPGLEQTFLVVSETYHPTLTSKYADVVLPAALWCEKEGVYGNTERRTQHMAKAIEPPGEARPDVDALIDFAHRMGYGEVFPYKSFEDVWNEYLKCTTGTDMELASYAALKEAHGIRWPVKDHIGTEGTGMRFVAPDDPYVKEGVDFYARPNHRAQVFARPYTEPAEMPDKEYPFCLTTGRVLEHWHTDTMTGKCPAIMKAVPTSFAEFNSKDATQLGIKEGDIVRLVSRRGTVELPVKIERPGIPRRGLIFATWFEAERLVNAVTTDAVDAASKEPEFKICAVRVEKV